jgi:hypothetical protein
MDLYIIIPSTIMIELITEISTRPKHECMHIKCNIRCILLDKWGPPAARWFDGILDWMHACWGAQGNRVPWEWVHMQVTGVVCNRVPTGGMSPVEAAALTGIQPVCRQEGLKRVGG